MTKNTIISDDLRAVLQALAGRLKARRLARDDRQSDAAARIGVSLATYRKLEAGHSSISIGNWLLAIQIYGDLSSVDELFRQQSSLFDQVAEYQTKQAPRQRAARRGARPKKGGGG